MRFFVLLLLVGACCCWSNKHEASLEAVLNSIDKGLHFMESYFEQLNLDSVIGARLIEGKTGALIARYMSDMPDALFERLRRSQGAASRVAKKGYLASKLNTPYYHNQMKFLIQSHFWDLFQPRRALKNVTVPLERVREYFDERKSDNCLKLVSNPGQCSFSEECAEYLAQENLSEYDLTHQPFLILSATQVNLIPDDLDKVLVWLR
ncbi:hypothetical protein Ciccas_010510 [Cichlidogyrus casuarinus]|uniref:Uncharacterized protein n=1 Tax=Cichlidogyrus casuarinus TaxID=1844966 RepID=A0ABD2PUR5_9PLAT